MKHEELLTELESLTAAMEDAIAIISGTIADGAGAGPTLKRLLAGQTAAQQQLGANSWRDRLLRSSVRLVALKARPESSADPELQTLIDSVLAGRQKNDSRH